MRERLDHFVLEIARVHLLKIALLNRHSVGVSDFHMRTVNQTEELSRNICWGRLLGMLHYLNQRLQRDWAASTQYQHLQINNVLLRARRAVLTWLRTGH